MQLRRGSARLAAAIIAASGQVTAKSAARDVHINHCQTRRVNKNIHR